MEYKAIIKFIDSADKDKTYQTGDTFEGTEERIEELSTENNKAGFPVIEGIPVKEDKEEKTEKEEKPKKEKKTDEKTKAKGSK